MSEKNGIRNYFDEFVDVTSPCEVLPPDYQAHIDRNMPEWWYDVDKDTDYQEKYTDGFMDGHSAGMAAGMNLIEGGEK